MAYTLRSKSSRNKAIKTKKKKRRLVFCSVYLFKIGYIRCNTQVSTCFQLFHGLRKKFSAGVLFSWSFTAFSCIKSCTLQLQLHLREQEVVGETNLASFGCGSMLRLVFESKLSNYCCRKRRDVFVQEKKITSAVQGGTNSSNARN